MPFPSNIPAANTASSSQASLMAAQKGCGKGQMCPSPTGHCLYQQGCKSDQGTDRDITQCIITGFGVTAFPVNTEIAFTTWAQGSTGEPVTGSIYSHPVPSLQRSTLPQSPANWPRRPTGCGSALSIWRWNEPYSQLQRCVGALGWLSLCPWLLMRCRQQGDQNILLNPQCLAVPQKIYIPILKERAQPDLLLSMSN